MLNTKDATTDNIIFKRLYYDLNYVNDVLKGALTGSEGCFDTDGMCNVDGVTIANSTIEDLHYDINYVNDVLKGALHDPHNKPHSIFNEFVS